MTDTEKLLKAISLELQKTKSVVVSAAEIAIMCGYAPDSSPVRRIIADPSFPPARSLIAGGNRRWLRSEVERWVERRFTEDARETLNPNG